MEKKSLNISYEMKVCNKNDHSLRQHFLCKPIMISMGQIRDLMKQDIQWPEKIRHK